ncbi:hypothetical protein [Mesorhizobium muleiense]|uniref:hypothetical protein n=1 Tax=Mesorhizobium muleiense TaxID=1004279 RepID=UPI001F17EA42|nr:hypothetical protein [Mesorhizobium muleiense]MCF6112038.1 hypothetical protein [Mesorhizobium muleiense]
MDLPAYAKSVPEIVMYIGVSDLINALAEFMSYYVLEQPMPAKARCDFRLACFRHGSRAEWSCKRGSAAMARATEGVPAHDHDSGLDWRAAIWQRWMAASSAIRFSE